MAMQPQAQWALEGELLQLQQKCDRLRRKANRTDEEKAQLEDLEKRKSIVEQQLRKERMKGYHR